MADPIRFSCEMTTTLTEEQADAWFRLFEPRPSPGFELGIQLDRGAGRRLRRHLARKSCWCPGRRGALAVDLSRLPVTVDEQVDHGPSELTLGMTIDLPRKAAP